MYTLDVRTCVGTLWGTPGTLTFFDSRPQGIVRAQIFWLKIIDRFKATLLLAIQLIRDHFRNGLGAHTYIYDTHDFNGTTAFWLYESFFSSKYSGGNLRINAQHVRMSVLPSVRMSVRLSVAMIYYIPTYIIHNVQQSCGVFSMGISNWLLSYFYTPSQKWISLRFFGTSGQRADAHDTLILVMANGVQMVFFTL